MNEKAFTLIEVLLIIVLLSMFFSIIMPNLQIYKNILIKKEIKELERDIIYIREHSKLTGDIYGIRFLPDKKSYMIVKNRINKSLKIKRFTDDFYCHNTLRNETLEFNANGKVSSAGTITVRTQNGNYKFVIMPVTGRMELSFERK